MNIYHILYFDLIAASASSPYKAKSSNFFHPPANSADPEVIIKPELRDSKCSSAFLEQVCWSLLSHRLCCPHSSVPMPLSSKRG